MESQETNDGIAESNDEYKRSEELKEEGKHNGLTELKDDMGKCINRQIMKAYLFVLSGLPLPQKKIITIINNSWKVMKCSCLKIHLVH